MFHSSVVHQNLDNFRRLVSFFALVKNETSGIEKLNLEMDKNRRFLAIVRECIACSIFKLSHPMFHFLLVVKNETWPLNLSRFWCTTEEWNISQVVVA